MATTTQAGHEAGANGAEIRAERSDQVADRQFEELLEYLRDSRKFDFTGYKRTGLARRIRKRLHALQIEEWDGYRQYLEANPEEFILLFNTVLINVTGFFRDPVAWQFIRNDVIPRIVANRAAQQIRAWCPGVASGEEAYTVALLMAEALGDFEYQHRVKIYATDVDEEALMTARHAAYGERDTAAVPPELLEKYFDHSGGTYTVRKDLRRSLVFGRHDLLQDAPIARVDLLVCRNTLMYFNAEAQAEVLRRFFFALDDRGVLFLGKAEMLFAHSGMFAPLDLKRRVFTKAAKATGKERLMVVPPSEAAPNSSEYVRRMRFREAVFDSADIAQIAIDADGRLGLANERARSLLGLTGGDISRPLQELEFMNRVPKLRMIVEKARLERQPATLREVKWVTDVGDVRYLDLHVVPLLEVNGSPLGIIITFGDATEARDLREKLARTGHGPKTADGEAHPTSEELEATHEELKSALQRLRGTTDEIRSTNEELETMNEELQSTNEEMGAVNQELSRRTGESGWAKGFLESILNGLQSGIVVLDEELQVRAWNLQATDYLGLRADEVVGRPFMNLDIGLPLEQLRTSISACLDGDSEPQALELKATNWRGTERRFRLFCSLLHPPPGQPRGVIIEMEQVEEY